MTLNGCCTHRALSLQMAELLVLLFFHVALSYTVGVISVHQLLSTIVNRSIIKVVISPILYSNAVYCENAFCIAAHQMSSIVKKH